MSREQLRDDLKQSLMDAAEVFEEHVDDAATANPYDRHIDAALRAFDSALPHIIVDQISLQIGVAMYTAPADAWKFHSMQWTEKNRETDPWDVRYARRLPQVRLRVATGQRVWVFNPVPSVGLLDVLGSDFTYQYYAHHSIGTTDAESTVDEADRPLLMLRAQAEAMKEIALRNSAKPVEIRASGSVSTANGPARSIYEQLMKQFNAQVEAQA